MTAYQLYPDGRFLIRDYHHQKPFSNFLPGIAGLYGTPMWVFYVNRGQAIASFGVQNKDNAILEFYPANKAYQNVTALGFRTFLKGHRHGKVFFYEPFNEDGVSPADGIGRMMEVSSHELMIREVHKGLGLEIAVRYFTVPGEPLAALARELVLTNSSASVLDLELLDGLPAINPFGMNEFFTKHMSRTIEAWMVVENLIGKNAPFFRLKVDPADRPEVSFIHEGNFYFGAVEEKKGRTRSVESVVDASKIFGPNLDFRTPKLFYKESPFKVPHHQILESRTPCAFGFASVRVPAGKARRIHSYFGHAKNIELLNRYASRARSAGYFDDKRAENKRLVDTIKSRVFTVTSSSAYDLYCGQTYLDNILRGGVPIHLGDKRKPQVFYVYSRKHGDLERDYNRFLVEASYFSQGDGNYRDVNQNRRSDVWFDPKVADTNIKTFLNLIQLDGFNPLVIKGTRFHFRKTAESRKILGNFLGKKNAVLCENFLSQSFNPGEFYRFLEVQGWILAPSRFRALLDDLSPFITREEKAEHSEGFWVDHWTYNLDLIESYLAIFPEDWENLLFDRKEYTFYDSDHRVLPRSEKYFLNQDGAVRQYHAVIHDKEKACLLEKRQKDRTLVRTRHGRGEVYKTTLFVKLLCLFTNKFASLDPQGVGIEMEADKPSWYDALNGLPGLLGSSLPETFELKRLALFLIQSLEDLGIDLGQEVILPAELHEFVRKLMIGLEKYLKEKKAGKDFSFWEAANTVKEKFRKETAWGLSGKEKKVVLSNLKIYLEHAREKIEIGLEKSLDGKKNLFPTYFENPVVRYKIFKKAFPPRVFVKPTAFKQNPLPLFLEGPVHALKVEKDPAKRKELLKAVRESELYDKKLNMYKVCASLKNASPEIGRAHVFSQGWLENESVWLHMEYKFMLEILKSGMTEEFFKDFKNVLIPFQPAERYGRSLLENSSFIVSSAFPDSELHGTGFVARLSGSTAEFLNMWLIMNAGKRPFTLGPDKKLSLRLDPHLPAFLFVKEETERIFVDSKGRESKIKIPKDSLAFLFLGKTWVVYHNPKRLDTFGKQRVSVKKISLKDSRGKTLEFKSDAVPSPHAAKIRDEWVPRIDVELG